MVIQHCMKEQQLTLQRVKDYFSHYQQKYEEDKKKKKNHTITFLKIVLKLFSLSPVHLLSYHRCIFPLLIEHRHFSDRSDTKDHRSEIMPADT